MKSKFSLNKFVFSLLASCLLWSACNQESSENEYLNIPTPKDLGAAYVSNPDGILTDSTVKEVSIRLHKLYLSKEADVKLVVVQSIGNNETYMASHMLLTHWDMKDLSPNPGGLLILVVADQCTIDFASSEYVDIYVKRAAVNYSINHDFFLPEITSNDFNKAVKNAVYEIIKPLEINAAEAKANQRVITPSSIDSNNYNSRVDTFKSLVHETLTDTTLYTEPEKAKTYSTTQYKIRIKHNEPRWGAFLILLVFTLLMGVIDKRLYGRQYSIRIFSPPFWLSCILPLIILVMIFSGFKASNHTYTLIIVLYIWINVYLLVSYLIINNKLNKKLTGFNRYAEYGQRNLYHYKLRWTPYLFPLLWLYWVGYNRKMDHLRNDPYPCPTCNAPTRKLSEKDEDVYMENNEIKNELNKSADYDVWICTENKNHNWLKFVYIKE